MEMMPLAAIKNCHPFTRAPFKLNDEQVDTADNLDLTMNLYNTRFFFIRKPFFV